MQENRAFPRVAANCHVAYRPVNDDPVFRSLSSGNGVMQNISGGGVCIGVREPVPVGTMLALDLALAGFPTSVIALGKVAWCRPSADNTEHEVGVEFWWIGWRDEAAQAQIRGFIAQKLRDEAEIKTT